MSRWMPGLLLCLMLVPASPAQSDHSRYLEVTLPPEVRSENVFIRYALTGEDFDGWVEPLEGVSSYFISTTVNHRQATGIRAILYAPGCAIVTLDLALPDRQVTRYPFACQPVKTTSFVAALNRPDRFYGHTVRLEMRYVARWAREFLGSNGGMVTSIPVGDAVRLTADGLYRLTVPEFIPDASGEFEFLARDTATGTVVARLNVTRPQSLRTPMGGLRLSDDYPAEIVFEPCTTDSARPHDAWGFATRPADTCD